MRLLQAAKNCAKTMPHSFACSPVAIRSVTRFAACESCHLASQGDIFLVFVRYHQNKTSIIHDNMMIDQIVLITGSTSGIGEASALEFARRRAKLVIHGTNNERGQQVVEACQLASPLGYKVSMWLQL